MHMGVILFTWAIQMQAFHCKVAILCYCCKHGLLRCDTKCGEEKYRRTWETVHYQVMCTGRPDYTLLISLGTAWMKINTDQLTLGYSKTRFVHLYKYD